jgi:hypothetical protein
VEFSEHNDELKHSEKQETGTPVETLSSAKERSCTRELVDCLEYIFYSNWGLNEIGGC